MSLTRVIGIDPGLVDTGVVSMTFNPLDLEVHIHSTYAQGVEIDAVQAVREWITSLTDTLNVTDQHIFVEGYRPRSGFGGDRRMIEGVALFARELPGKKLDNMGIKKVVKTGLLAMLRYDDLPSTNHRDIHSAMRIALLGMLKDDDLNALLTEVVKGYLHLSTPWSVYVH